MNDILLKKDNLLTTIELDKTLDYKSIIQAAFNQKTCDFIFKGIYRASDVY